MAQQQHQHRVEVYLEAKQLALACLVQRLKASLRHQPSQQAPSLEVVALLLQVGRFLEVQAPSQQPLDHYSVGHQLLCSQRARHRVKLKEVNRSLVEHQHRQARQEAQLSVAHLLRLRHLHSVGHHRQVVASLVALELGQAACLVVARSLVASVAHLPRQRPACRLAVLQLKVHLVVAASLEVEVEPHQAASSVVHQLLRHLEEPQQLEEVVSSAVVPPKLQEDLYLEASQQQHHSVAATHKEKENLTQRVSSAPQQSQQRTATRTRSSAGERFGKIK